ncbi:hypothetical protein [Priestia koreensis]|uniref:Uncharacterized protein n=1 Tax=Priestia koreensis TaxID=284581 RepID=A0A0M0L5R1_9BACI|nr:hypothetical protein [Priestia koreensis]KOO46411.1 hypothetical protein AMD01_11305 [Priestia koreensis]
MEDKKISDAITKKEIENWKPGEIIFIKAGTGKGKSYFIKNRLYEFAKKINKKILMLVHRRDCGTQFQGEIDAGNKSDFIHIKTYQYIEFHAEKFDFSQYQYIVCDESHYYISDAAFNKTTDIGLEAVLKQRDKVKIFMSATGDKIERYLANRKGLNPRHYPSKELEKEFLNFNFIKTLSFFKKDETLEGFVQTAIRDKIKAIFFIHNAEKAYKLYSKYKEHCLFNCSKHNKRYYQYVNAEKIDEMLHNERFDSLILITTTCMDAGVSIKDKELKDIVCDVKDTDTLIQCIGRKRILDETDKLNLYIKNISNQQIGGTQTKLNRKLKKADFFREYGTKKYIEKYGRDPDSHSIVYDEVTDDENKGIKKLNELMYYKCKLDVFEIEIMKTHKYFHYANYLAYILGFYDKEFDDFSYNFIEDTNDQIELESYLDSMVGRVMLSRKDRTELIEKINVRDGNNNRLLRNINILNGKLQETKMNYIIEQFETSRIIHDKKRNFKQAWKVRRLCDY